MHLSCLGANNKNIFCTPLFLGALHLFNNFIYIQLTTLCIYLFNYQLCVYTHIFYSNSLTYIDIYI